MVGVCWWRSCHCHSWRVEHLQVLVLTMAIFQRICPKLPKRLLLLCLKGVGRHFNIFLIYLFTSFSLQFVERKQMVVAVTVSNLRAKPQEMESVSYEIDHLQLSQLVFMESVYTLVRQLRPANLEPELDLFSALSLSKQ